MKAKSNKTVWITVAAVVVIAAVIRLYNNQNTSDDVLFTDFIRSLLHIGLITAWGFSIYQRVVQKQARHYLCGIAVLMILWLNFKVMKYYICTDVNVSRYLWYLYYLPLVGIPLYTLFASLFIGKTEDYKLKWQVKLLYIPAILLFLMVMTNDLHKFAFSFPQHDFSPDNYQHGIGYFMVFGWFALCTFASFYVMYSGGKIKRKPRAFAPLIVALVLTVYYIITYMVENPVTKLLAADLSSACSLLFAAVFECCIYCGLLPTNTRYDEMFETSVGNSAQIVDENYNVRYASASAEPLSVEQIKQALNAPVALSEGKLLHTAPIGGGYTVWTEDISELTNLRRELTETKEELEERTAMLIDNVEITGVVIPIEGETPKYDCIIPEDCGYYIDAVYWENSSYQRLDEDDTFVAGKAYTFNIVLFPEDGYTFKDRSELKATVNGDKASEISVDANAPESRIIEKTVFIYHKDEQIIDVSSWGELKNAFDEANKDYMSPMAAENITVRLQNDLYLNAYDLPRSTRYMVMLNVLRNITLDFNGHTLYGTADLPQDENSELESFLEFKVHPNYYIKEMLLPAQRTVTSNTTLAPAAASCLQTPPVMLKSLPIRQWIRLPDISTSG